MKVVCIKEFNYSYLYHFEKYNVYEVYKSKNFTDTHFIKDDGGYAVTYTKGIEENFLTLKEYRKQKLNKLNENCI